MLMTSQLRSDWSISVTNSPHMGQTKKPLCLCHSLPPLCVDSLLFFGSFTCSQKQAESWVLLALIGSDQNKHRLLVQCDACDTVITSHLLHLSLIICSLLVLKQIKRGKKQVPVNTRRTRRERKREKFVECTFSVVKRGLSKVFHGKKVTK